MTRDDVLRALRNADAAGDTAAARRLAQIASGFSAPANEPATEPAAPVEPVTPQPVQDYMGALLHDAQVDPTLDPGAPPPPPEPDPRVSHPAFAPAPTTITGDESLSDFLLGGGVVGSGLDGYANLSRGIAERAAQFGGNTLKFAADVGRNMEEVLPLGGIQIDMENGLRYAPPGEYNVAPEDEWLNRSAEQLRGTDLGYEPFVTPDDIKKSWKEDDYLKLAGQVLKFSGQEVATSLPEMAATLMNMPVSAVATIARVANERPGDVPSGTDYAIAAPVGVVSELLNRYGAQQIFGKAKPGESLVKSIIRGGTAEATTEAAQEALEYGGETALTGNYDPAQQAERALFGALGGGPGGGAIAGVENLIARLPDSDAAEPGRKDFRPDTNPITSPFTALRRPSEQGGEGQPGALPSPQAGPAAPAPANQSPPPTSAPAVSPTPSSASGRPGAFFKGPTETATTAKGTKVPVQWEVVEAEDLLTSDREGYDQSIQPRDRKGRSDSTTQIADIAANFDPTRVYGGEDADRGAPIVGPDNMVESGNGRIAAIRQVYGEDGEAADAYRTFIAEQTGFDPADFDQPVIVRRRMGDMTPEQRRQFAIEANESATGSLSEVQRGKADVDSLTDIIDYLQPGDLTSAANRDFVRAFMGKVNPAELGSMQDAQGNLSQTGIRRIQAAVLAKAYGGSETANTTLGRMLESSDDNVRSATGALIDVAPAFAKLRDDQLHPDYDISENIVKAIETVSYLRERGLGVDEYLNQADFLEDPDRSVTDWVIRAFYNPDMTRAAGRDRIAAVLRYYAEEVGRQQGGQTSLLMNEDTVTAEEYLREGKERAWKDEEQGQGQGDIFATPSTPAGNAEGGEQTGGQAAPTGSNETGGTDQGAGAGQPQTPATGGARQPGPADTERGAETETPAEGETETPPEMTPFDSPDDAVWPKVTTKKVDMELKDGPFISEEEAQAQIQKWKSYAHNIKKTEDHSKDIILSFFDHTGEWSAPYRAAGYKVIQYDIKDGADILKESPLSFDKEGIELQFGEGHRVVGILSAPPCTTFASSGSQWWTGRHDNPKWLEEMWGMSKYADSFASPHDFSRTIIAYLDLIIAAAEPDFHAMENPIGRLASDMNIHQPAYRFDPHNFGDPYTKKTNLWGEMNTDLPTANVRPEEGSKMHKMSSADEKIYGARSVTPEGMAYAFFVANNANEQQFTGDEPVADPADNMEFLKKEALDEWYDLTTYYKNNISQGIKNLKPSNPENLELLQGYAHDLGVSDDPKGIKNRIVVAGRAMAEIATAVPDAIARGAYGILFGGNPDESIKATGILDDLLSNRVWDTESLAKRLGVEPDNEAILKAAFTWFQKASWLKQKEIQERYGKKQPEGEKDTAKNDEIGAALAKAEQTDQVKALTDIYKEAPIAFSDLVESAKKGSGKAGDTVVKRAEEAIDRMPVSEVKRLHGILVPDSPSGGFVLGLAKEIAEAVGPAYIKAIEMADGNKQEITAGGTTFLLRPVDEFAEGKESFEAASKLRGALMQGPVVKNLESLVYQLDRGDKKQKEIAEHKLGKYLSDTFGLPKRVYARSTGQNLLALLRDAQVILDGRQKVKDDIDFKSYGAGAKESKYSNNWTEDAKRSFWYSMAKEIAPPKQAEKLSVHTHEANIDVVMDVLDKVYPPEISEYHRALIEKIGDYFPSVDAQKTEAAKLEVDRLEPPGPAVRKARSRKAKKAKFRATSDQLTYASEKLRIFEDAGFNPETVKSMPIQRQFKIASDQMAKRYGFQNVVRERTMDMLEATEMLQEMYVTGAIMMHSIRMPAEMFTFNGKIKTLYLYRIFSDGQSKSPGTLAYHLMYDSRGTSPSRGPSGQMLNPGEQEIGVARRNDSFAHEWGHALDARLLHDYAKVLLGKPLMRLPLGNTVEAGRLMSGKVRLLGTSEAVGAGFDPDVAQAFADLMNAMFYDDAKLALYIADLKQKIDNARDPDSQNQKDLREKLRKALEGASQAIKTPLPKGQKASDLSPEENWARVMKSKYATKAGAASKRSADAEWGHDAAYQEMPTEMLARAFEAYIGMKLSEAGIAPTGMASSDAFYIAQGKTDNPFALQYPDAGDRQRIFTAMDVLFRAIAESDMMGNKARNDEGVRALDALSAPDKGNDELARKQRHAKRAAVDAINAARDMQRNNREKELAERRRKARDAGVPPKQVNRLLRTMDDWHHNAPVWSSLLTSIRGQLLYFERLYPQSEGMRRIRKTFATKPGSGEKKPFVFENELESHIYRLGAMIEDIAFLAGDHKTDDPGGDLRRLLVAKDYNYDKLAAEMPDLLPAVAAARKLLDTVHNMLKSAGFDVGYAPGFLPRMIDVERLKADPELQKGFRDAARADYKDQFDQYVATESGVTGDQQEQVETAAQLATRYKNLFSGDAKDLYDEYVAVMERLSSLRKQLKNRPDDEQLLREYANTRIEMLVALADLLPHIKSIWSQLSAEQYLSALLFDDVTLDNNGVMALNGAADYLQKRGMTDKWDERAEPYMIQDAYDLMSTYVSRAVRKVMIAKHTGQPDATVQEKRRYAMELGLPANSAFINQDVGWKLTAALTEFKNKANPTEAELAEVQEMVSVMLGLRNDGRTPQERANLSVFQVAMTAWTLSRSVFAQLPEPSVRGYKGKKDSGWAAVKEVFKAQGDIIKAAVTDIPFLPDVKSWADQVEYNKAHARLLGLYSSSTGAEVMAARYNLPAFHPKSQEVMQRIWRYNGMHWHMNSMIHMAIPAFYEHVAKTAKGALDGDKDALYDAKEMGIDDPVVLRAIAELGERPSANRMRDFQFFDVVMNAAKIYSTEMFVQPKRVDKPKNASTEFSLIFALQSFNSGFQDNVVTRIIRTMGGDVSKKYKWATMMGIAPFLMMVLGFNMVRYAILSSGASDDDFEKRFDPSDPSFWILWTSLAGIFGRYDLPVNIINSGVKYAATTKDVATGPYAGQTLEFFDAMLALLNERNSDNTYAKERKALMLAMDMAGAAGLYAAMASPSPIAVPLRPFLPAAAGVVGSPKMKRAIAEEVFPKTESELKREANKSDARRRQRGSNRNRERERESR